MYWNHQGLVTFVVVISGTTTVLEHIHNVGKSAGFSGIC